MHYLLYFFAYPLLPFFPSVNCRFLLFPCICFLFSLCLLVSFFLSVVGLAHFISSLLHYAPLPLSIFSLASFLISVFLSFLLRHCFVSIIPFFLSFCLSLVRSFLFLSFCASVLLSSRFLPSSILSFYLFGFLAFCPSHSYP